MATDARFRVFRCGAWAKTLVVAFFATALLTPASPAHAATVDPGIIDVGDPLDGGLNPMVLSPDKQTLAITSWGCDADGCDETGNVFLLNLSTGVVTTVGGQTDLITDQIGGVVFSPDGTKLYATVWRTSVLVIDVATARIESEFTAPEGEFADIWSIEITTDGKTLLLGPYNSPGLIYFDIGSSQVTTSISSGREVYSASSFMSKDGSLIYTLGYDGGVDAYRATSDPAQQERVEEASWALSSTVADSAMASEESCLSPDGTDIFVMPGYVTGNSTIYKADLASGEVLDSVTLEFAADTRSSQYGCVVSPDGKSLFVTEAMGINPGYVREYSTSDLNAPPITHTFPYVEEAANNMEFTYGIVLVGCDAYVSGFYSQVGILRDIGCVKDDSSNGSTLAKTGAPAQTRDLTATIAGAFALLAIGLWGSLHAARLRRRHGKV